MGNIYASALQVLREEGWIKGQRHGLSDDKLYVGYCAVGAMDRSCGHRLDYDDHLLEPLNAKVREYFPERTIDADSPIAKFNDHKETTKEDVEMIFEKVIAETGGYFQ